MASVGTVTYKIFPEQIVRWSNDETLFPVMCFVLFILPIWINIRNYLTVQSSKYWFDKYKYVYGDVIVAESDKLNINEFKLVGTIWLKLFSETDFKTFKDRYNDSFSFMISYNYARISSILEKDVSIYVTGFKDEEINKERATDTLITRLKIHNDRIYRILEKEMIQTGDLILGEKE
jgi:hypothetical protein